MKFMQSVFQRHGAFVFLYIGVLILGLFIYKDYGLSWDETALRIDNGYYNYNYVEHGDYYNLIEGNEKYHGAAFELMLIYLEKGFGMTNEVDIFYMRHLVNFIFFAIGLLFFYLIIFEKFRSQWLGLLGCLLFLLSPRIFADGFYNSKDISLLVFTIISIYTFMRYMSSNSAGAVLAHALASALVVDMRILGIIVPIITIVYSVIRYAANKEYKVLLWRTGLYLAILIPLIIFFWPVMWRDPLGNFIAAFREMSKYHWFGSNLYMGRMVPGMETPWHYLFVWIGITTPILQLLLFLTGLFLSLAAIFGRLKSKWRSLFTMDYEWINLGVIFIPIIAVIVLKSVIYDGWRHLYFIYPSMILIGIAGLKWLTEFTSKHRKVWLLYLLVFLSLASTASTMYRLHPYEMVYFNKLGGKTLKEIKPNFELDYWGLSILEALKYLVVNDPSDSIKIHATDDPGIDNMFLLQPDVRKRLYYYGKPDSADYFITFYREHPQDFHYPKLYSVNREGADLTSLFATNTDARLFREKFVKVFSTKNNYESTYEFWHGDRISARPDEENNRCYVVIPEDTYSSTFEITFDSSWTGSGQFAIDASLEMLTEDTIPFSLAFQVNGADGQTRSWDERYHMLKTPGRWSKVESLSSVDRINKGETLKVFLINAHRHKWMMDDFNVTIYQMKPSESL